MAVDQPSGQDPPDLDGDQSAGDAHNRCPDQPDAGQSDRDVSPGEQARPPSEARTREEYAQDIRDQGPPMPDDGERATGQSDWTGDQPPGSDQEAARSASGRVVPGDWRTADDRAAAPDTGADRISPPDSDSERSFSSPREAASRLIERAESPTMYQ